MLNSKKININNFLFLTVLLLLMLKPIYSYMNAQWSVIPGSRAFEATGSTNYFTVGLNLAALLCVILLAWKIYSKNTKKFSNFFNCNLIIILFTITGWTFISFMQVGVKNTFYLSSNPLVYLTVLAIIIGFDRNMWAKLVELSYPFALFNIVLAYYHFFSFTSMYSGALPGGNSPVMTYFITGFWLTAVSVIGYEDNKRKKSALIYALIVSLIILSVVMYSRGWLFQSVILMVVAAFHMGRKKGIIRVLKASFVVIFIGLVTYYILENYYLNYLISFMNKFGTDTRSFQYVEIFRQTHVLQFIFGGGMNARYYLDLYGEYSYIDNQYIFTLFRYGILMLIPYIYFYASPVFSLWKTKIEINKKSEIFIVVMWLLALGGLSVYNGITIDIKNIILPMVAGRCLYISNQVKKDVALSK